MTYPDFAIDRTLLAQARQVLQAYPRVYWLLGGAGAGKTTLCQTLAEQDEVLIYDMDAHIYGSYHARFTPTQHPVNAQWQAAPNGLAWLLAMPWEVFKAFNQAALPEYLTLFGEDLAGYDPAIPLVVDGGLVNPALLAEALPASHIICLTNPGMESATLWEGSEARLQMKAMVTQLEAPENAWEKFLAFDAALTANVNAEAQTAGIPICSRLEHPTVSALAACVAAQWGW